MIGKNHLGISIPIGNLIRDCRQGIYSSEDEIIEAIEKAKRYLDEGQEKAIEVFRKSNVCDHEFDKVYYTFRRMFIGYKYVYERTCTKCRYTEYVDDWKNECLDQEDLPREKPEWAEGALEKYWNNHI